MTVASKRFYDHHHQNHNGQNKGDLVGPAIVNTAVIQMPRLHLLHPGACPEVIHHQQHHEYKLYVDRIRLMGALARIAFNQLQYIFT